MIKLLDIFNEIQTKQHILSLEKFVKNNKIEILDNLISNKKDGKYYPDGIEEGDVSSFTADEIQVGEDGNDDVCFYGAFYDDNGIAFAWEKDIENLNDGESYPQIMKIKGKNIAYLEYDI